MRAAELWSTWLLVCGVFSGILISAAGLPRHDLLVRGEATFAAPTFLVAVAIPAVLVTLSLLHGRMKSGEITPRLETSRVRFLFYGAHVVGIALGLCCFYLWSLIGSGEITVGQTGDPSGSSPGQAWDTLQWVVYLAPPVAQIVLFAGGIALMVLGGRGMKGDLAIAAEVMRRRRLGNSSAGMQLTGQIVTAEAVASAPDQTRVVAEVQAPDGLRAMEAIVPGAQRGWLSGATARVSLATAAPYDPNHALITARRFLRTKHILVSACPVPVLAP